MSIIRISPEAVRAIQAELAGQGITSPVRIDLRSTGCCDPSLGLWLDGVQAGDRVHEVDGLTFVISPETFQTVGEVTIDRVDKIDRKGYVLTSQNPLSEWEGFGVCDLRKQK